MIRRNLPDYDCRLASAVSLSMMTGSIAPLDRLLIDSIRHFERFMEQEIDPSNNWMPEQKGYLQSGDGE